MTLDEAYAWLRGERSWTNTLRDGTEEAFVRIERADAATTEQAYWVVRAHQEGLLDVQGDTEGER